MNEASTSLTTEVAEEAEVLDVETVETAAQRCVRQQRLGTRMILAGSVITVLGIVLYCAATFAGDLDAGLADVLMSRAVPLGRATLGVLALGTLVWLVGSYKYMTAALEEGTSDRSPDQGDAP